VIRGLFRLALGLVLAAGVLWIALPVAASGVASAAVAAAGLSGDDVSTSVVAHPPLKLLLLEADAVVVHSGPAAWRGLRFGALDLTLSGLRLGSPPSGVAGRLADVEFPDAAGAPVRATSIVLSGSASTPDVRVNLGLADVSTLIGRVLPEGLGGARAHISLSGSDLVRIATPAGELTARIALRADGSLDLIVTMPGTPTALVLSLLTPGDALPVHLSAVGVDGESVVLSGSVDARSLGL
jgi:hypothetical protein